MTTMFVIEDEPVLARNLVRAFAREDFHVLHAAGIAEARGIASETLPDVALLDLRLPDGSGLDMLGYLLAQDPDLPVIMMTGFGSVSEPAAPCRSARGTTGRSPPHSTRCGRAATAGRRAPRS